MEVFCSEKLSYPFIVHMLHNRAGALSLAMMVPTLPPYLNRSLSHILMRYLLLCFTTL